MAARVGDDKAVTTFRTDIGRDGGQVVPALGAPESCVECGCWWHNVMPFTGRGRADGRSNYGKRSAAAVQCSGGYPSAGLRRTSFTLSNTSRGIGYEASEPELRNMPAKRPSRSMIPSAIPSPMPMASPTCRHCFWFSPRAKSRSRALAGRVRKLSRLAASWQSGRSHASLRTCPQARSPWSILRPASEPTWWSSTGHRHW